MTRTVIIVVVVIVVVLVLLRLLRSQAGVLIGAPTLLVV